MTLKDDITLTSGEYYWVRNDEPLVFHGWHWDKIEEPANREPEVMMWRGDHFEQTGSDLYWWAPDTDHLRVLAHIPKPGTP